MDGLSLADGMSFDDFLDFDPLRRMGLELNIRSSDMCVECNQPMKVAYSEYYCDNCNIALETDTCIDEQELVVPTTSMIRIVGPNSQLLQRSLYSSNSNDYLRSQEIVIFNEYLYFNRIYSQTEGKIPFSHDSMKRATCMYNMIQVHYVKRSEIKRYIMGALLWYACAELNCSRDQRDIAELMRLGTRGLAKGDSFVRQASEKGHVVVNPNADMCKAHVSSAFERLGLNEDCWLCPIVEEIVRHAAKSKIGCDSIESSKVAATVYVVLVRAERIGRDFGGKASTLSQVFSACGKRKHTVEKFVRALRDYHNGFFKAIYEKHGLYSGDI
jgi:hypothetical protein